MTGFGAAGAGAAGFGVTEATTGLTAAAGLRVGALRAAVFRAAGLRAPLLAVLRAGFLAAVLRAGFLALDFRAVLRALVFLAPAPRRALLAVVFLLLVVRFFPLVLVAMASAPILLLLPHSTAQTDAYSHESRFHWSRLAVPHWESIVFFIIALIATENGNLPCKAPAKLAVKISTPMSAVPIMPYPSWAKNIVDSVA